MENPLDNDDPKLGAQPAPKPVAPGPSTVPITDTAAEPKGARPAKTRKKRPHPAIIALIVVASLAAIISAAWYFFGDKVGSQVTKVQQAAAVAPAGPLAPYVKGSIAHMVTLAEPKTIDNIPFIDRDRHPLHIADFKGQVVVLNVWATWCAPCRFEMPTLAKLQKMYDGKGLKVLPLSVDTDEKFDDVKSFMDVQDPLQVYADPNFAAPQKFGISGMPATLILDKQGHEVARLDGEASWDTPEVKALMDKLLSE
ncbi:MAG: TlpA family protein disulfide reductase [Asticcacaulis sp.]